MSVLLLDTSLFKQGEKLKLIILILFILVAGIVDFIVDQSDDLKIAIASVVYATFKILIGIALIYAIFSKPKSDEST